MKHHVAGQFTNRDHIGCFLELDVLLVNKAAPVMEDDIGVKGTIFALAFYGFAV